MNMGIKAGQLLIAGMAVLLASSGAQAALVPFTLEGNVESADAGNIFSVSVGTIITATGSIDDSLLDGGIYGSITDLLITVGDLTFDDSMEAFGGSSISLNPDGSLSDLTYEANEGVLGASAFFDSFFTTFTGSAFNGPKSKGSPTELSIAGHWDANSFVVPTAAPVPAAVWLFGSGLLGLLGIARKRKV